MVIKDEIDFMFCEKCGHELVDRAHFCAKCGAVVGQEGRPIVQTVVVPSSAVVAGVIPQGVQKWNWGAAILTWIWALGNGSYGWALAGFLLNITGIGWIVAFFLFGFNGSEWAWKNKKWENIGHFQRVQKTWSRWGVGLALAFILIGALEVLYEEDSSNNPATQSNTAAVQEMDMVTQADYSEGYKAGYVDGRGANGTLGDSYAEPATEERKGAYIDGYLEGFLKGCREGSFDCSEVERALKEESDTGTVQLIPSTVN